MSDESSTVGDVLRWFAIVVGVLLALAAILYFLRKYIQGGQYTKQNRIDGKVVIVTGANTGLGKETVLELAARGAHVHMACRDMKKCNEAREEIVSRTGNTNVFARQLDLASLASVRSFAKKFTEEEPRLDILINNAGVMAMPRTLTADGFEMQLGVNHLGHFLLTNLLLDVLRRSAPGRIVVLSSMAHYWGRIDRADLNGEKNYSKYTAYSQSKLANVLFVRELARRLAGSGITANAVHPGVVKTELGRYMIHSTVRAFIQPFVHFFFKSPVSGAQTTLAVALDEDLKEVSGKYFADCRVKTEGRRAQDDEMARWLWDESEKLTKLADALNPV